LRRRQKFHTLLIAPSTSANRTGAAHMAKSSKHPGFKAVQAKIASKEGVSKKNAGAILAASSRNASAASKRANPRLSLVRGK